MDESRSYLTIRETAAPLELSTRTIHRYIAEGKLKAYRVAGEKVIRIKRQDVVVWHERLGLSADEIATEYGLSLADVYAALAYYYDHREEIDQAIRADEAFVAERRKHTPSRLKARLGG